MITAEQLQTELAQCIGTEQWYKHFTGFLHYTDGIKTLAESAECYWLVDTIASYQGSNTIQNSPELRDYQLWILTVAEDSSAVLNCYEDSPKWCDPVLTKHISLTDFPMLEIKLYVENGILLLPSEH